MGDTAITSTPEPFSAQERIGATIGVVLLSSYAFLGYEGSGIAAIFSALFGRPVPVRLELASRLVWVMGGATFVLLAALLIAWSRTRVAASAWFFAYAAFVLTMADSIGSFIALGEVLLALGLVSWIYHMTPLRSNKRL